MKDIFQVIKTIQLTEKATLLGDINNSYVFRVDPKANKSEIKMTKPRFFTVLAICSSGLPNSVDLPDNELPRAIINRRKWPGRYRAGKLSPIVSANVINPTASCCREKK